MGIVSELGIVRARALHVFTLLVIYIFSPFVMCFILECECSCFGRLDILEIKTECTTLLINIILTHLDTIAPR